MKIKCLLTIAVLGILVLLGAAGAWAMSSQNYRVDWLVPLSGGGGGRSGSASYALNFTIGQSATGFSTSTGYKVGLGYWYGAENPYLLYLPILLRN
jgi:hypothetical protein